MNSTTNPPSANRILPRYPIYIPSKGRHDKGYTAKCLITDGVPFKLVIEEPEYDLYAKAFGEERLLVLPFRNPGSVIPARNFIKQHATEAGFERHWQLDDNILNFYRRFKRIRFYCNAGNALRAVEDFTDRYENIAISGLNYSMFSADCNQKKPFNINCRVYSCTLILNSLPYQWRFRYNEDTDYCLQVLANGWCTVLVNVFMCGKMRTMTIKGGNTTELYDGDGRLKMARSLERVWPGIVETYRRFKRPQHHVNWAKFDTPLKRKPNVIIDSTPNEYGLTMKQVKPIRSKELRRLMTDYHAGTTQKTDQSEIDSGYVSSGSCQE